MGKRVAGMTYVKVDGDQLEINGGCEAPLGDTTKEIVMGTNGPAGFKETARKPTLKVSAIFRDDFPMDRIVNGKDMTITAEWPNGKVYTLSGAILAGEPTAKADDGTTDLEFEGMRGQWQ